jgi:hypothetical protein
MSIKIPENPNRRDFDSEVDEAVKSVLSGLQKPGSQAGALSVNHGQSHMHVRLDVAARVAELFKSKGYHAHYCISQKGTPYALEVTTYPTDYDI